jgi:hypothetical protein
MTIKGIQEWIYKHMVWLLILASVLLFTTSKLNIFGIVVNDILEKVSYTVLSSGVFAAVLKAIQFTGIFKKVIEEIILGTDFIENRSESNQQELWKTTSKAIYKKKFPEISSFIENRILESYLPTNKDFYYRDYRATINIIEITENFDISYTQTLKFDVVLDENLNEANLVFSLTINEDDEEKGYINECEFFKINGKEVKEGNGQNDVRVTRNDNKEKTNVRLVSQNGNKVFTIHRKVKRRYSLKNENYKLIRMTTFTKGVEVVISFPENVGVSFFNVGNVTFFEPEHTEVKNQISRSHRNDVILPYQGFGMSFELKE